MGIELHNSRTFSDLDLNFIANPVTGDVYKKFDENAIKASIKNLVLINHFEKHFHPEIGSEVRHLLFELPDPQVDMMLSRTITTVITTYEPRVDIVKVIFKNIPNDNSLGVVVIFKIKNTSIPIILDFILNRER